MKKIRLIGDIHGDFDVYEKIIKDCDYSIQVGDMGYKYNDLKRFIDPNRHKFIPGNHENYNEVFELEHVVKTVNNNQHFGMSNLNGLDFFFVRGGYSIDRQIRDLKYKMGIWPQTYFPEEELNQEQSLQCFEEYKKSKPKILIAHECPRSIARMVGNDNILMEFGYNPETFTTSTSQLLQEMIDYHPPEQMYFGHYHRNWIREIGNTFFICIADQDYIDLEIP